MIVLSAWFRIYQDGEMYAVPQNLWRFLRMNAGELSQWFDGVWLPPEAVTWSGNTRTGDGYGVREYRNVNGTWWGSKEDLMAAIATCHAHGMIVGMDLPARQQDGENGGPGRFLYGGRRGETEPSWFQGGWGNNDPIPPFSPQDSIPDTRGDWPDGRIRSYQHSAASLADIVDVVRYKQRTFDFDLMRMDEAKAIWVTAQKKIVEAAGIPATAEYMDGSPANLDWYASDLMGGKVGVYDFTLHWRLQAACNGSNATLFDQDGWGYGQQRPELSVGVVENHDTDGSDGEQIIFNKAIAYALMLCLPLSKAVVFAKDYFPSSVMPGGYGLKHLIDNASWVSRTFAVGNFERRWVDRDVYAYTRDGNGGSLGWSGGLLVVVNFNTSISRTVTLQTTWLEGQRVQNYSITGTSERATVRAGGKLTIAVPANTNSSGRSYQFWAVEGVSQPVILEPRETTQVVFAATPDYFVGNAMNKAQILPDKYSIKAGSKPTLKLESKLIGNEMLIATLRTVPAGTPVATDHIGAGPDSTTSKAPYSGMYEVVVEGFNLQSSGVPYQLSVTYMGAE